jgi:hypothetical protein
LHKINYKGLNVGLLCAPDAMGVRLCYTLPVHKLSNARMSMVNKLLRS